MRCTLPLAVAALVAAAGTARAQPRRIVEEPTDGVYLPATPLAGDQDARAVSVNPAGLQFVGGVALALAVDAEDRDVATSAGPGVGVFLAAPIGGRFAPSMGLGLGVEWLRPSRTRFTPDYGTPLRATLAWSFALGRSASLGLGWHHFYDDNVAGGSLGGLDTYDLGLGWRIGNHLALGSVVRDLGAPRVGAALVQRRYELEVVARPTGTDRLELGLGGRIGERRADVDGWLRGTVKVLRGLFVHAALETRELQIQEPLPSGDVRDYEDRDLRATLGLEVSFGGIGVATYGTAGLDEEGDGHLFGGTVVARMSSRHVEPVQGYGSRIERIELSGDIGPRGLARMLLRLRAIEHDGGVRAVVFTIDGVGAGWATVQELRDQLVALHAAGIRTFAYLVDASMRDYYLASACDKVYLDPVGAVRLTGFAGNTLYFKGAFDKIGVNAQFEKIAEYKSFPESYTDIGPSAPALEMTSAIYDQIFDELVGAIAKSRGLDRAAVIEMIDAGPYSAGDLGSDKKLVDAVADPEQVAKLVAADLGRLYFVGGPAEVKDDRWERPAIAIIYADGDIVDGDSRTVPILGKMVGAQTMVAAIEQARRDDAVKAIVLRIDSPGGSAVASELMSRAVFATRGKKPIICSMGDVAASGGYYLAAGCDRIFADPMTITGSIGIFSGKFDISGLLAKVGVTVHTNLRGKHADLDSMYRPYTDEERTLVHHQLEYMYGRFTGAVSKGRGMTEAEVDKVGRGHVWTGKAAQGVQLVDEMGGLNAAIDYAKGKAGLGKDEKVRIVELPKDKAGLLAQLLGSVARARAEASPADALDLTALPVVREALGALPASVIVEPDAIQARLPFDIAW